MRKIQHFEDFGAICVFPLIQKWPEKPTFKDFHGSAFEPQAHIHPEFWPERRWAVSA